jgi:hypothetical protein
MHTHLVVQVQEYTEIELSEPEARDGIVPKYIKLHELTFMIVGGREKIRLKDYHLLNDPEEPSPEAIRNAVPAPSDAIPAIIDYESSSFSPATSVIETSVIGLSQLSIPGFISSKINPDDSELNATKALVSQGRNVNSSIAQAQVRTVYYNRVRVRDYAVKWWNSFNPLYRSFGADCTNYASQLLIAGGWTQIQNSQASDPTYTWWYGSSDQSRSWAFAPATYSFLSRYSGSSGRVTPVDRTSKLDVGDIVQVDWGKGEGLSHTMIVSRKRASDGMVYLTGHTNPHLEMPVYDILANYRDAKLFTWKVNDSYVY